MHTVEVQLENSDFKAIHHVCLKKEINNHSSVEVSGLISDSEFPKHGLKKGELLKISASGRDEFLFIGEISIVNISKFKHQTELSLTAFSYSVRLDKEKKSKLFQNTEMTYREVIDHIFKNYQIVSIFDKSNSLNNKIAKVYFQYNETDWNFFKRIMSEMGLYFYINDCISGKCEININPIGIKAKLKPEPERYICAISEQKETHVIETYQVLDLTDQIEFNGNIWIISETNYSLFNGRLNGKYELTKLSQLDNFSSVFFEPDNGLVLLKAVIKNNIDPEELNRVTLALIEEQIEDLNPETHWFPWSTGYSAGETGLSLLPEVKEEVTLFIPLKEPEKAYAGNSVRTHKNKFSSLPDTKILKTPHDKMIYLNEHEICLSAKENEVLIKISDNHSIEMQSGNNKAMIQLTNNQMSIIFNKNTVTINEESITLQNKNSTLNMDNNLNIKTNGSVSIQADGIVSIKASKINLN